MLVINDLSPVIEIKLMFNFDIDYPQTEIYIQWRFS